MAETKMSKTIPVRLPPDLHQRVRKRAEERGVNVSKMLRKALEQWLARTDPKETDR